MSLSVLQYCYNTVLIMAFTSVISFALCMTLMRRREFGVAIIGLFLFFLLDTIIVDLTEFAPLLSDWYNSMFLSNPAVKTVIYLGLAFFSMYSYSALKRNRVSPCHAVALILLGMWYVFIPMINLGAVQSFLYYSAYQVFIICACAYALRDIPRCGLFSPEHQKFLKMIIYLTIVFSVLIVLEDYYVIFFVDIYAPDKVDIYVRNRCEDLLRISYTIIFYVFFIRFLHNGWLDIEKDLTPADTENPGRSSDSASAPPLCADTVQEDEYKKLKFAQQLYLTERELDVFSLLLKGMNNQEISDTLTVSVGTVKAHIHNIYQKADVVRRYELMRCYEDFVPEERQ